jgi:hypothetical protein
VFSTVASIFTDLNFESATIGDTFFSRTEEERVFDGGRMRDIKRIEEQEQEMDRWKSRSMIADPLLVTSEFYML